MPPSANSICHKRVMDIQFTLIYRDLDLDIGYKIMGAIRPFGGGG